MTTTLQPTAQPLTAVNVEQHAKKTVTLMVTHLDAAARGGHTATTKLSPPSRGTKQMRMKTPRKQNKNTSTQHGHQ